MTSAERGDARSTNFMPGLLEAVLNDDLPMALIAFAKR
jgi:hypothetical protein